MRLAFRESMMAFRRAPLLGLLSITTIAFSLFAFGLFGLLAVNLRAALRDVENRVEIRVFLADGTSEDAIATLLGDATAFPEVAQAGYVSPDSGLARARLELPEFKDVLDVAVLPGSIEVKLKDGFRDPTNVKNVAGRLSGYPFVDEVRYGEEWVEKLYRIRTIAAFAGSGLGLVFALVAIIIIGSTIRMAVLSRARDSVKNAHATAAMHPSAVAAARPCREARRSRARRLEGQAGFVGHAKGYVGPTTIA